MIRNIFKGLLMGLGLISILAIEDRIDTHYTRNGVVTNVSGMVCTITDESDNEWIYVSENLKLGSNVKMHMNTNHTDSNIYDDIIEKVK